MLQLLRKRQGLSLPAALFSHQPQTEFIEFSFANACVPSKIEVYEQRPGALVHILGKAREAVEFTELWSGPSNDSLERSDDMRTFVPPIKKQAEAMNNKQETQR